MSLDNYTSEFALNMLAVRLATCRLSELTYLANETNYFDAQHPCHIYFILRRPKLSVDKNGFSFDKDKVFIKFKAQKEDTFESLTLEFLNTDHSQNLRLETKYPYNKFEVYDGDRIVVDNNAVQILTKLVAERNFGDFEKNLDLEVLYIGQAYGDDGSRTAIDRLKNHETLQKIYEEANRNNPDKDILIGLFSFEQLLLTSFDGRKKLTEEEDKLDNMHMENVLNKVLNDNMNEKQRINFTEAALIKYFQPPYNSNYKDTFPSPKHSYTECYDLDINSICVEIDSEPINCRLYSNHISRRYAHYGSFPLNTREDRVNIFKIDF